MSPCPPVPLVHLSSCPPVLLFVCSAVLPVAALPRWCSPSPCLSLCMLPSLCLLPLLLLCLFCPACYPGAANPSRQLAALKVHKPCLVVATPGRLLRIIKNKQSALGSAFPQVLQARYSREHKMVLVLEEVRPRPSCKKGELAQAMCNALTS